MLDASVITFVFLLSLPVFPPLFAGHGTDSSGLPFAFVAGMFLALAAFWRKRHATSIEGGMKRPVQQDPVPALHDGDYRFRILTEMTSDLAYCARLHEDGGITVEWANDAFVRITGFRPREVFDVGEWPMLVHPLDHDTARVHRERVFSGHASVTPLRIVDSRGRTRHLLHHARPELDPDGVPIRVFVVGQDVTPRRSVEALLDLQHDMLLALARSSTIEEAAEAIYRAAFQIDGLDCGGLYLIEPETGDLVLMSHRGLAPAFVASVARYGPDAPEVTNLRQGRMLVDSYSRLTQRYDEPQWKEGLRIGCIVPLFADDRLLGSLNLASHRSTELTEEGRAALEGIGAAIGAVIVRIRTQEALAYSEELMRTARDRAQRSERLKDAFIATISHEIRTPLNIMMGFAGMLDGVQIDDDMRQESLRMLRQAGERLVRSVEQVLEVSSIRAGTLDLKPISCNLTALVEAAVLRFTPMASEKDLALTMTAHDELDVVIDPSTIEKAMAHLLDNAIKFTPSGSIVVSLFRDDTMAVISVCDTGIGMSEEYIPELFSLFSQEDQSYARPFGGLGLGLALVKMYVESNGGRISVQSTKGEGTCFELRLPSA